MCAQHKHPTESMLEVENNLVKHSEILLYFLIFLSSINLLSACREEHVFCNINKRSTDQKYLVFPLFPVEEDDSESSVTVCESEQIWFKSPPTHAFTKDRTWKELQASQSFLKSPILVERCKRLDKPCFDFRGVLSERQSTKCIQKYMEVMIQFQVNNSSEKVKIPTACVCSVRDYYFPNNDDLAKYKYKFR